MSTSNENGADETELLAAFPPERLTATADLRAGLEREARVLVVLDDDPTGTQSVAGLPVLTAWEPDDFAWALGTGAPAVYVLTNTRSLPPPEAAAVNREVVRGALAAAQGRRITFVSRSDSTLRGHFPLEPDTVADEVDAATGGTDLIDGVVLVPAFPEAGRITLAGTHYLRGADGALVPVAATEFARDGSFGYSHSHLPAWVEEKTSGRVAAADVLVLDLATIRSGPDAVASALAGIADRRVVVADSVSDSDLRALASGLAEAERRGTNLLYRVGPPFVRARIGQEARAPLTALEVFGADGRSSGGLVVVGSHVSVTTRQLARLVELRPDMAVVQLDVPRLLDDEAAGVEIDRAVERVVAALVSGDAVLQTSRTLVTGGKPEENLRIARRVSAALVQVVERAAATCHPRFVIGKGGITSSDIAVHALRIRHGEIVGPMLPGIISLWRAVDGPFAEMPYVVFAGNVGDDDALEAVVATLTASVSLHDRQRPQDGARD